MMIIKNPMCTRVTASVDYHLASSQTKFALLVRQSIQLIIMKQYLNLKPQQAPSVCSIFTFPGRMEDYLTSMGFQQETLPKFI